jgi:hypothetical protein
MKNYSYVKAFRMTNLLKITSLVFGSVLILAAFLSCSGDEDDPITSQPPVFSETPVDIAYDPVDSSFGDIIFMAPVLTPFGASIGNNQYLPGIEYFTVPGAPVLAVTEGIVDTIVENPLIEGDYELRVISIPGSDYTVIYDHILDVAVLQNSQVLPGDTLGQAGNWSDFMRRTILQVTLGEGSDLRSYCPLNFGDSIFNTRHQLLLAEYNRQFPPGYSSFCLQSVVGP